MRISLLILLVCVIQNFSFGQSNDCRENSLWLNCEDHILSDTIIYEGQNIGYYLVYKNLSHKDVNGKCRFNGVIIIPDSTIKLQKKKLKVIFKLINEKVKLYSFTAYSTCEAFEMSRTAILGRAKTNYLKKHYLGNFQDNNK